MPILLNQLGLARVRHRPPTNRARRYRGKVTVLPLALDPGLHDFSQGVAYLGGLALEWCV